MSWSFRSFLSLFFPEPCILCGCLISVEEGRGLCFSCRLKLDFYSPPSLLNNGMVQQLHSFNLLSPWAFALCKFSKGSGVQELLHALKYERRKVLASDMGSMMAQNILLHPDFLVFKSEEWILVPVPMHPQKVRTRGYNQAYLLAEAMAGVLPFSLEQVLIKQKLTKSQTQLNAEARKKNVGNNLAISKNTSVKGKKFILVDDVFTTGATIASCMEVLYDAGAAEVAVLCFAYATYE